MVGNLSLKLEKLFLIKIISTIYKANTRVLNIKYEKIITSLLFETAKSFLRGVLNIICSSSRFSLFTKLFTWNLEIISGNNIKKI